MMCHVLDLARKQLKVFNAVVGFHVVLVMNNLLWFKISPEIFFHYKAVFSDIITSNRVRMVRAIYINIASVYKSATFPAIRLIGFWARHISKFFGNYIACFLGMFFTKKWIVYTIKKGFERNCAAFNRTIFLSLNKTLLHNNIFFAYRTQFFCRCCFEFSRTFIRTASSVLLALKFVFADRANFCFVLS